jgi:hypothetical protein
VTNVAYVPTIVLVAIGLVLLITLLVRVRGIFRLFGQTVSVVATNTQDRTGLLRARSAALRVAVAQRRHPSENPVTSHPDAD